MQAAPPPKPVFNLSPDAQAMADTFNAVVDICKQGSNHAQEHKLHTVDEGLNSLFGACSVAHPLSMGRVGACGPSPLPPPSLSDPSPLPPDSLPLLIDPNPVI